MRPALVHLAKGHITKCDDMRHRRGLDVDFNPVLETLGLHELLFPAPPLPEIPEDELEEEEDDREYSDEVIAPSELLDSPITAQEEIRFMQQPPRLQVLSQQVCENAIHSVPPGIKELDWLERTWPRLWTMLDNEATARLSDRDYSIVIMEVSLAAAVLCPGGEPEGANPNERRFVFHLCREMTAMLEAARPGSVEALEHYSRHSPQPHLSYLLCGQLMGLTLTNQFKFKTEEAMMLLPYLKAAIWEICAPLE